MRRFQKNAKKKISRWVFFKIHFMRFVIQKKKVQVRLKKDKVDLKKKPPRNFFFAFFCNPLIK
jgi:hypothetical protein